MKTTTTKKKKSVLCPPLEDVGLVLIAEHRGLLVEARDLTGKAGKSIQTSIHMHVKSRIDYIDYIDYIKLKKNLPRVAVGAGATK